MSAASDFAYPEQQNGTLSPLKYPLVGGTLTPEPSHAPGHDPEPASEGDLFNRGFIDLEDEVPPAGEAPLRGRPAARGARQPGRRGAARPPSRRGRGQGAVTGSD